MKTRTITLSAADLLSGTIDPQTGVPFRWLDSLVKRIQSLVPDSEEPSCRVVGLENLTVVYEHTLTEQEELTEELVNLRSVTGQIRMLLPREGESMTPAEVSALRSALG